MRVLTAAAGLGIATLVALIVASSLEMSLAAGLRETVDTRWGVTTMVDLYVGLVLFAAWIAVRERRTWMTVVWVVALCCLGNLATLAYVLMASARSRSLQEFLMGRSGRRPTSTAE